MRIRESSADGQGLAERDSSGRKMQPIVVVLKEDEVNTDGGADRQRIAMDDGMVFSV